MAREWRNELYRVVSRPVSVCVAISLMIVAVDSPMVEATEYFVAVDHPSAADSNSGLSLDQSFRTLRQAVRILSPGDTLFIKEGIYREPLILRRDGTGDNQIVAQAYPGDEGMVVIRGSDVVTGWTNDAGFVWSIPWQSLPLIEYPRSAIDYGEYSRRREMVFVDGKPLQQVLSNNNVVGDCFWMDDVTGRIWIRFPGDPNAGQVEISVRAQGVMARGRSYQVIRGIRVEHVSPDLNKAAMSLGSHQLVEDCRVEHNNGIGIRAYSDSTIRRTVSSNNGRAGIILSGSGSVLESNETNHNSWRYGPRWDAGGIKIVGGMPSGNRLKNHISKNNNGRGIWFDTTGSGNFAEASITEGNLIGGVVFEATIGPNWIINSIVIGTVMANDGMSPNFDGSGIAMLSASDTIIYNNTIVDVSGVGILIGGADRNNHEFQAKNTRAFNNIVANPGVSAIRFHVWGDGATEERLASHHLDNNLYYQSDPTIIFPGSGNSWTLAEWQLTRGEDLSSLYAAPLFTNPQVQDYSLQTNSPAIDAGVDFPEVTEDFMGLSRPKGERTDVGAHESPASGIFTRESTGRVIP